jgi:flagellar hook-associated protein 2
MGSAITFSGFNNIDFGSILEIVMQQERTPVTALETRKTALKTQNTTFATFASKLSALESAAQNLAKVSSLSKLSASTSNADAVGVATSSGTVEGTYDVVVSQLAKPQVMTSQTTYSSVDETVATSGTISIALSGNPPVDIPITGPMTLSQLASAINGKSDAPVSASVVQVAPGDYRLVLTGRSAGTANAFTVNMSQAFNGGTGLEFTDTNGDGTYGNSVEDSTQAAKNALLTVNNIAITSTTNTVDSVIPGVTLTLGQQDPSKTVTVKVAKNRDDATALIEKFVSAYNDVTAFLKDQNTAASTGKTSIARDPLVRGLQDTVRRALLGEYGSGSMTRLPEVGIGFDRTGKMTFDKEVFAHALETSQADVQALFGGANGSGGAFGTMKSLVQGYTQAGGLVASLRNRLDEQVTSIDARIATLEAQLARRRQSLQAEYAAADQAMTQIKSQGNSLSTLGNQYSLF